MRIALVQMKVEERNNKRNKEHGIELLNAVDEKTDIAVLPEIWTTGYSLGNLYKECETKDSSLIKELSNIAVKKQLTIVAGSVPLKREDEKIYNSTLVFNKQGDIIAEYDKLHMFTFYNEDKFFQSGTRRIHFNVEELSCALSICYDIRFPEFYRTLALEGAQIVFVPAEWPEIRSDAWNLLLKARAVENQMYICAVNASGKFKRDDFYGHSMLIDPYGEILVEAGKEETIVYGVVDKQNVVKARQSMPVLNDVRRESYL